MGTVCSPETAQEVWKAMRGVVESEGGTGYRVFKGCPVPVAGKTRFACVEGPEFNGYDVDFDEAMRRQGQYRTEESEARENHVCRIGRGK